MPYKTLRELPDGVQHVLPHHAQEIYKEAFNSAYSQYDTPEERHGNDSREEVSHKVTWSAVKKAGYQKGADELWHRVTD